MFFEIGNIRYLLFSLLMNSRTGSHKYALQRWLVYTVELQQYFLEIFGEGVRKLIKITVSIFDNLVSQNMYI